MSAALTRRAALSGAVASVAMAGVAAAAVPAPATGRMEWGAMCAAYYAARVEEVRLLDRFEQRQGQWFARRNQREPKPIQPAAAPLDKSMSLNAILAQTDAPIWKAEWTAYETSLAGWQARYDADERAFMGDCEARFLAASKACDDAFGKVKGYPVTSIAMLNGKAAVMNHRYAGDFEGHDAEQLMRDIARLAGEVR